MQSQTTDGAEPCQLDVEGRGPIPAFVEEKTPGRSREDLPRDVPVDVIEHAREFAARCATYADLRTRSPLLEHRPEDLYRRAGRITSTEHALYGVVRRARNLGFAGARLTYHELGELVGRHERSAKRAVRELLRLELLRLVPQYRDGGPATMSGYDRSRSTNTYALGAKAREPSVLPGHGAKGPRISRCSVTPVSDNSSSRMASLSEERTEPLRGSVPLVSTSTGASSSRTRGEESTASTSDRPLPRPSMPASPAAEGSGGTQSKIRTAGLVTLGEVARAKAAQNARQDEPAPDPAAGVRSGPRVSAATLARLPADQAKAVAQVDDPELAAVIAGQHESFERYWARPRQPRDSERPIEPYDAPMAPAGGAR